MYICRTTYIKSVKTLFNCMLWITVLEVWPQQKYSLHFTYVYCYYPNHTYSNLEGTLPLDHLM